MSEETPSTAAQLRAQWSNPGDIFSLLLIIGSDVVQKALSHTAGYFMHLPRGYRLYLTPVAFSFGWVAYAFYSLSSVFGEGRLMAEPDTQVQVINCSNGFVRENHSWLLSRLLRDYEKDARIGDKHHVWGQDEERVPSTITGTDGNISLKIEIFTLEVAQARPAVGWLWKSCWAVIILQLVISAIPWICFGNWAIFMVTAFGTLLSLITGSLPQWAAEKWSSRVLSESQNKTIALTRGNGHQYAMIIIGYRGAWDLEAMASGRLRSDRLTRVVLPVLAAFWIVLLISVTGLTENTWFLILVGGIGMLQNIIVSAASLSSREMGLSIRPYKARPSITGYQYLTAERQRLRYSVWNTYTENDVRAEMEKTVNEPDVRGTMGALMELEKLRERAGAALLPVFFPGDMDFNESIFVTDRERMFWEISYNKIKQKKRPSVSVWSDRE